MTKFIDFQVKAEKYLPRDKRSSLHVSGVIMGPPEVWEIKLKKPTTLQIWRVQNYPE